jgi:hypothetical protein
MNSLSTALAACAMAFPEVKIDLGQVEHGWVRADEFVFDDAAIDEYLAYEGSFHPGIDRKTCAAAMMVDYCYVFTLATVPLFVGFGITPDLSLRNYAMKFYKVPFEHDGRTVHIRRAYVRFLSLASFTDRPGYDNHILQLPDTRSLCDRFRTEIEGHMEPLVLRLARRTGLSRSALWRLVSDAVAGRFLEVGRHFGCTDSATDAAMVIVKQRNSPLHNRQLHYFDLTLRDQRKRALLSWTFRSRGGCCRYYMTPGGELCETCVLQDPAVRDSQLLRAMQAKYDLSSRQGTDRRAESPAQG